MDDKDQWREIEGKLEKSLLAAWHDDDDNHWQIIIISFLESMLLRLQIEIKWQ